MSTYAQPQPKTKSSTYSYTLAENPSNHGSAPCQHNQQGDVHVGTGLPEELEVEALRIPYCFKGVEPVLKNSQKILETLTIS